MTETALVVETRVSRGCIVVSLAGELDLAEVPALEESLNACADGLPVIVDVSELEFILSAGLHTLMGQRAAGKPAALVYRPGSNIARVLQIVQAGEQLPLFTGLAEALETLGDAGAADGRRAQLYSPAHQSRRPSTSSR